MRTYTTIIALSIAATMTLATPAIATTSTPNSPRAPHFATQQRRDAEPGTGGGVFSEIQRITRGWLKRLHNLDDIAIPHPKP